ncbi:protoporphyrinogen oxidase [Corynebacterium aquatimens]|uniref:Coproporphyrinogen III oxidase n=1 Tax=Corynebacterium aquatimens TaxID=1190508 RepID=A0A931DYH8_9CORY|nr:protoporphyrinogen oxidase [Corynebacterium aquatimens]MBG6122450.1 oxygen-dependent protoporphyrinogen oxidase [Corynebacterium aquatimens]WJY65010.1 Protoporphyrinogen oxidase [Corynebacterium aquatimens]
MTETPAAPQTARIAIIGAGLAGLTAAYELNKQGLNKQGLNENAPETKIDVYEATDRIGGKLYTVAFEAGPTDMGAEAFLSYRTDAMEFFEELSLKNDITASSSARSLVYCGGATHDLPTSGIMGIPSSSEPVKDIVSEATAQRIDDEAEQPGFAWTVGGDANVGEIVRARYGDEVADRLVSALLGGVYSCAADDLGVRATMPQLAAEFDRLASESAGEGDGTVHLSTAVKNIEARRSQAAGNPSGQPKPAFAAFKGGYAQLYETLAEKSGADIYVDAFISGIERAGNGYRLTGGEDTVYDHVILATPAPTTALLLKKIAPEASASLSTVKLANSVVVGLRFDGEGGVDKQLPDNSGVLVAADEPGITAKAFTFSSRKWPHIGERGGAMVRASFGRFGDDIAIRASEDDLVDWALDDLQTITGFDGRAAGLEEIYVQRWFGGLPRYDEHHLATVAAVREKLASVPGISVTGAWVGGVGVPAVIANAREVATSVARGGAAGVGRA